MVIFFFPLAGSFFSFSWVNDFDFVIFFLLLLEQNEAFLPKHLSIHLVTFFIWQFRTKDFWPNSGHDFFSPLFWHLVSFDHIGRYFDLIFFVSERNFGKIPNFATWAIIRVAGYVHGHRGEGRGVTGGLIFDFLLWCNINFAMKN